MRSKKRDEQPAGRRRCRDARKKEKNACTGDGDGDEAGEHVSFYMYT